MTKEGNAHSSYDMFYVSRRRELRSLWRLLQPPIRGIRHLTSQFYKQNLQSALRCPVVKDATASRIDLTCCAVHASHVQASAKKHHRRFIRIIGPAVDSNVVDSILIGRVKGSQNRASPVRKCHVVVKKTIANTDISKAVFSFLELIK